MAAVRKTWLIDPDLVRDAQRVCGARTETETITRALREMLIRDEIDKALERHSAVLADMEVLFPDPAPAA
jgi:Arc/MetJ family transcription regulator